MRSRLILPLLLLALQPLAAQTPTPEPTPTPGATRTPQWRCFTNGGVYSVGIDRIVSVSVHEYRVDNVARVTEVNIDTVGNALVRFYYLEPAETDAPGGVGQGALEKIREIAEDVIDRSEQAQFLERVIKSYPTSTHAHTIEYRVSSRDELKKIFDSADTAYRTRRPSTVRVGKPSW